jgi:2',3'-cyclic-nucleotide 2'-phosphodiesterase (5'-nucleotidase family)
LLDAIVRALENGLASLPEARGRFPQVSGVVMEADTSRPTGSRIISITIGGAPLDEAKIYKVATNDFLSRGGDGYSMFQDAPHLLPADDSPLLANEVMNYLRAIGTVRASGEPRITLK